MKVAFAVALAFLAGTVGFALGEREPAPPGRGSVDVGFLYDMIGHHEQAIEMSHMELGRGSEQRIEAFAREILFFQGYEIGLMTQQLRSWGHRRDQPPDRAMAWMGHPVDRARMPGMASKAQLDAFAAAQDRDADAVFVALMIEHHEGGVHMAEEAARRADTDYVRELAGRMARQQRTEIREMELARDRLGLPTPVL